MSVFQGSEKLGDIVAVLPGASRLFIEQQIDFCCGGDRRLDAVLEQHGLDADMFLRQLNRLAELAKQQSAAAVDWRKAPLGQLVDHIVRKHHGYLTKELPELSEYVTRIMRVHSFGHPELTELHKLFYQVKVELEQHMIDEEVNVFPLIKQAEEAYDPDARARAISSLGELEHEHAAVGNLLKQMRDITDGYRLPQDACPTYTLTFQKLEALESDTFEHVHLENNILFPRLGA